MDFNIWRVGVCGLLGLALSTALVGCEEPAPACTLAEYSAGLVLRFEGPDGTALPTATYEIVLDVDGDVYSVACGKPDESSDFSCDEVEGSGDHRIDNLGEFGDHRFFALRIMRNVGNDALGPQEVIVKVVSGDAPLVDTTLEPTYTRDEPNGEGCGLVDHEVEEIVVIDPGGA